MRYAIVVPILDAMEFHQVTSIDYSQKPPPPALSEEEAEWLAQIVNSELP